MAYVPFDPSYSSLRTPAYVAAELARRTADQSRVNDAVVGGNAVMGGLVADCCSDPAYAGQGFFDSGSVGDQAIAALTPGSGGTSNSNPDVAALSSVMQNYPLTPVDILTGTYGFPMRKDGRAWPRPRLSWKDRQAQVAAYPNFGPAAGDSLARLVPPCPCFSSAAPVPIRVPVIAMPPAPAPVVAAPIPAPPAASPAACPYPACSTGNVCLDLVTGCVLNSQVDPAQQTACALANYGVFGNQGQWFGRVWRSCKPPQYLGTPLPNPPQADPSMRGLISAAVAPLAGAGLGQVDSNPLSGIGGLLAVVGMFGIVVWANRKL